MAQDTATHSTGKSMARNAAAMMVSQAIGWGSSMLLLIFLPRILGAEEYGKLQFLTALICIFAIVMDLGTTQYITLAVARDRSRAPVYLTNLLALGGFTALLAYACLVATVILMRRSHEILHLTYIMGGAMLFTAATTMLGGFLQGFEQVHRQAWGNVIDKALRALVILGLLFSGRRLYPIVWATFLVGGAYLTWNAYWVLRQVRPRLVLLNKNVIRSLVAAASPFFLFGVFAQISGRLDITMLEFMAGSTVVGWYGAATRLTESLFFIPYIFYSVSFPVLSRLSTGDPAVYREAVHRGFRLLAAATAAVCVTTAVLAGPIVELLYTQAKYPGTAPVLRIMSLTLAFRYLNTMVVMVLQTNDRQAQWAKAAAVATLVAPTMNYLLIPRYGHIGAAITIAFTEGMLTALALRACPRGILGRSELQAIGRALLAGGIFAAALLMLRPFGVLAAVFLGMPLYALAVLRFQVIAPADLALVKNAVFGLLRRSRKAPF